MQPPDSAARRGPGDRAGVVLVQCKPRKGRYQENLAHVGEIFEQLAHSESPPDIVVLPEGGLTGYFLEGAVYELALDADTFAADLARAWHKAGGKRGDIVSGFYENDGGTYYNSSVYIEVNAAHHRIVHVHRKMFLPTYGVFDEERFLSRGRRMQVFQTRFGTAAMLICEDIWHAIMPTIAAVKGATMLFVPSAAPGRGIEEDDELGSIGRWREILHATAAEHGVFIAYCGLAGFEGGKGMTGSSRVVDPRGRTLVQAPALGEHIVRATIDFEEISLARASLPLLGDLRAVLPDLIADLPQEDVRAPGR